MPPAGPIGLAAASAAAASILMVFLQADRPAVVFFVPAVMAAAWLGGTMAALAASLVAWAALALWLSPPGNPTAGMIWLAGASIPLLFTGIVTARLRTLLDTRRASATDAEQSLRESEARLAGLVDSAMDAVIAVDAQHRIVLFNPAAEQMFGCAASDALGGSMDRFIPASLREAHRSHVEQFGRTGLTNRRMGALGTLSGVRASGEQFPLEASISRSAAAGQKVLTVILRDITERKRAEAEHARLLDREHAARAEAEAASRLKDEFLATMSHELRTPLNAILGWATMLEQTSSSDARLVKGLQSISRNTRVLTELVEEVLDVSRIISGKMRLEVEGLDLGEVVDAAVESVLPAARARNIEIRVAIDPGARPMNGDRTRLQQVVWNLLSNAIKFTPPGGRVDVLAHAVNGSIELTVKDTGIGIDPAFLPYAFDRFRQADATSTRAHGGLGLGLAIVRHLVELHGGSVGAHSEGRNAGATFVMALPARPAAPPVDVGSAPAGAARAVRTPAAGDLPPVQGVRVLIVDDDRESCDVMVEALRAQGASVGTALSVVEAIDLLHAFKPDVVLSDIGMPGLDGYA
ncbi:MAG TPA: ATP-binding protein, partial [Candidatus Limnocylindrales bacterium]|nr:ATP-binding protein [Candidatus Limnocylindrales bacterium]